MTVRSKALTTAFVMIAAFGAGIAFDQVLLDSPPSSSSPQGSAQEDLRVKVPDVVGLTVKAAVERMESSGFRVIPPSGSTLGDRVTEQSPSPDVNLLTGATVRLFTNDN